ncbi:NADH-quinone oxidoreductase subunit NuoE [Rhizomicrobium electricum]|uniref:NADH-quinone oxidoreductase subunit NuoE n=1 Tax=Rhizomicrobium electricum TaxID=480070 RepID=A0ABN1ER85_9PROT|nr:NADH-quinone oxidoreductase subunit E [Rhizomicrobium electricum]
MTARRLHEEQPAGFAFSEENMARVNQWIAKFPPGRQRSAVISALWIGQEQEGWVTKPMIEEVAKLLDMPYIRVLEVATFYTMFHLKPVGRHHVQVCTTTPCWLRGSDDVVKACKKHISDKPHSVSADGEFSWEEVECLGACVNAPMVLINSDPYEDLTGEKTEEILEAIRRGETPKPGSQIGRHASEPEGGPTTLTERALYDPTLRHSGPSLSDDEAKNVTPGVEQREAPTQKPPGAAT